MKVYVCNSSAYKTEEVSGVKDPQLYSEFKARLADMDPILKIGKSLLLLEAWLLLYCFLGHPWDLKSLRQQYLLLFKITM